VGEVKCLSCGEDCLSCSDSSTCTQCLSPLAAPQGGTCLCKESIPLSFSPLSCAECAKGTFYADSQCLPCPQECESCTTSGFCTACRPSQPVLTSSGACVAGVCQAGSYFNGNACPDCGELCTACLDESFCQKCQENAELKDGNCKCKPNYVRINEQCLGPALVLVEVVDSSTIRIKCFPNISETLSALNVQALLGGLNLPFSLVRNADSTYTPTFPEGTNLDKLQLIVGQLEVLFALVAA
jgi:hypothetical protein